VDQNITCPGCQNVFPRASGLIFHLEHNLCRVVTAAQFKGYLQHKGIIAALLEDPTMMEQMVLKDFNHYRLAAEDNEVGGGVDLPSLLNEDNQSDDGVTLMEPMVPQQASAAKVDAKQREWPSLQSAGPSFASRASTGASNTLVENMKQLAIKHNISATGIEHKPANWMDNNDDMIPLPWPSEEQNRAHKIQETKLTATPWPLPVDYKEGDPLPKAPVPWASGSVSKRLFKDAKPTPMTPDWEARLRKKEEKDHKSNILHHQFWNPAHEDYDSERFYDPMIEKYKCPFPGCE
jgi:hypothetical protein